MEVYQVLDESGVQSRFEVAARTGLTPLVGRDEEVGLLHRYGERAKEGAGQVMLLRASPASTNRAWCRRGRRTNLQQLLQFQWDDTPQAKLERLAQALARYRFSQTETLPLLASLLSLPHPEGYPPLTLSPQRHKQKTQEALVAWLVEEAERQSVYCPWEDVHWASPSAGHPRHAAGLADSAAGSAGHRERGGPAWSHAGAGVLVRAAQGRFPRR